MTIQEKYFLINEAAEVSGKSIQTIRRAIKGRKFSARRKKTPQGFIYLISRESFSNFYNIPGKGATSKLSRDTQQIPVEQLDDQTSSRLISQEKFSTSQSTSQESGSTSQKSSQKFLTKDHLKEFQKTIQQLTEQQHKERENFMRLIQAFQDRIMVLENQVRLLEAPKRKWYQFWK